MPGLVDPIDRALIDCTIGEDGASGRFELGSGLVRHDGALYGGTGLAVTVLAMEAASDRAVLWASTQFVSSPRLGATISWTTEKLAEGKRATQLLVRATSDGRIAFTAVGSAGVAAEDGLTGDYQAMPELPGPHDTPPRATIVAPDSPDSYATLIELREAAPVRSGARAMFWVRRRDRAPMTPASIAFAADFVPLAIARAAGKVGAGSSLDNSMRFRGGLGTEWVLLELDADFAFGGYGHGTVRVWGEDGSFLASGSQTAAMRYLWDEGEVPRLPGAAAASD